MWLVECLAGQLVVVWDKYLPPPRQTQELNLDIR